MNCNTATLQQLTTINLPASSLVFLLSSWINSCLSPMEIHENVALNVLIDIAEEQGMQQRMW